MTTITITLPEELAERAKAKGLLSPSAIEAYVREKLDQEEAGQESENQSDPGSFDPRLKRLVNPAAFRKGEILGDIIGPFHEEWGEPH
jgi:hypothetical protein